MKVRISATHKSGRVVTFEICGVPFWKWLQATLNIGWIRESRRKFKELIDRASDENIDSVAGQVMVKTDSGRYRPLYGPRKP